MQHREAEEQDGPDDAGCREPGDEPPPEPRDADPAAELPLRAVAAREEGEGDAQREPYQPETLRGD